MRPPRIERINARRDEVHENLRAEAGVGVDDPPRPAGMDDEVPPVIPFGAASAFPAIPVADILRDSLEEGR